MPSVRTSIALLVIVTLSSGCVRAGFFHGTDGGNDSNVVSHDTGQPKDARIDDRSPFTPIDSPAWLDGASGTAPQGCDPGLGWKTCKTAADCRCNAGTCYFWCPSSEPSCSIKCENGAICSIHCDGDCTVTCTTGSTCTICRMAGGGHHCIGATCEKQCPTLGCS